jgi:hypothetical protein
MSCGIRAPLLSDVLRGIVVGHRRSATVSVPVQLLEQAARALEAHQRLAWCMDARHPERPRELVRIGARVQTRKARR